MRPAISPWQWQPWTVVFPLRGLISVGLMNGENPRVSKTFYCPGECKALSVSASSTQHMWELLAGNCTAVLPRSTCAGKADQELPWSMCQLPHPGNGRLRRIKYFMTTLYSALQRNCHFFMQHFCGNIRVFVATTCFFYLFLRCVISWKFQSAFDIVGEEEVNGSLWRPSRI